jgi:hypothetical protein
VFLLYFKILNDSRERERERITQKKGGGRKFAGLLEATLI